jgi:hypothetical protein
MGGNHKVPSLWFFILNNLLFLIKRGGLYKMIRGKETWVIGLISAVFLLVLSISVFADGNTINGAPYLREGAGAKSMAIGGASTAVVDDATSTVWNVAGLSKVDCTSVSSMYTAKDGLDRRYNFLALAQCMKGVGTFGMAWINAGVSDIAGYAADGTSTGMFNSADNAFLLSYGTSFDPVRLGGGIKILTQKVDPDGDTDMGFGGLDIGIMPDPVEAVTVGLAVQNVFGKIAEASVPVGLRFGTALRLLPENNLMLAVDLEKAFVNLDGRTAVFHMGAEYWAMNLVGFRLGVTSEKEFSAGIGINISNVWVDYAYSLKRDGLEPDSHYVSISASIK